MTRKHLKSLLKVMKASRKLLPIKLSSGSSTIEFNSTLTNVKLRTSFARTTPEFNPILINEEELEIVQSAKLLGVAISHNLSWNNHITEIVKKAAKRLYFLVLVQLKRAKVPFSDLVLFYTTCVRSILTCPVTVFHHALPKYLKVELERIQKRALVIICPSIAYNDAL